ncbi:hypothetical protein C2G38_2127492 [Gigaspora rosea]|uniref:Uncharacterized protein n=1 Tax=Gigaspora rosea TaxID=44941 RepID=A0A397TVN7_9GLOM|nr:hypothetical protein C2G38_2127492 [Gigaspora rosea]
MYFLITIVIGYSINSMNYALNAEMQRCLQGWLSFFYFYIFIFNQVTYDRNG